MEYLRAKPKGVGSLILKTSEQAAKKAGFKRGALTATRSGLAFYKSKAWISINEKIALLPDGVKIEFPGVRYSLGNQADLLVHSGSKGLFALRTP